MALVSQSEFARLHGVSRKTATVWKADGYLKLKEGLVDVEASDRVLKEHGLGRFSDKAKGNSQGNSRPAGNTVAKPAPKAQKRPPVVDRAAASPVIDPGPAGDDMEPLPPAQFAEDILAGRFAPMPTAERMKENALAGVRLLDLLKKAGEQIDLTDAEEVFFEQSRATRDAWLNWPNRIGPLLAADLGLDAKVVTERLIEYVQRYLSELGEPAPDFGGEEGEA